MLYLANGLPHYFNLVLSRLNDHPGLEVVVVAPRSPSRHIGAGVFQSREGIGFRLMELQEYSCGPLAGFRGLTRLLLKERPDVVVLPDHLLTAFFLHPGLLAARLITGARLVLKSIPFLLPDYHTARRQLRELPPPSSPVGRVLQALGLRKLLLRLALEFRGFRYRRIDGHVNYIDEARDIYGSYGVRPGRICVTRNSPDTDAMRRTERALREAGSLPRRDPHGLLHVGRLVAEKRANLLIEAMPAVLRSAPQARLTIVGDGPERARFEDLARSLGVADAVRFVGAVYDPAELACQFLFASLFVLPGLGGLSINEAMFYGLAVVCSAGDGTEKFLVREGVNGTFFRSGDRRSLERAIVRLLSDTDELRRMGARSREIIDREINIATVVERYVEAFARACA